MPLTFPSKDAAVAHFKAQIAVNAAWANRALERIYAYQTEAEKAVGQTSEFNGVGFSGRDAEILSSFAKKLAAWKATPPENRQYASAFSPKMQALVHKLMPRYAAQLVRHLVDAQAIAIVKPAKVAKPEAA